MKKMRSFVTLLAIIILSLSVAVPVCAETTVAEWHTDEFKETYAKVKKTEAWGNLDESVRNQLENYARADKDNAESLLILRTIDFVKYVDNHRREDSESIIGKYIDLLSSKEFHVYLLLSELAKYDGLRVDKNKNGHYAVFKTDIPE